MGCFQNSLMPIPPLHPALSLPCALPASATCMPHVSRHIVHVGASAPLSCNSFGFFPSSFKAQLRCYGLWYISAPLPLPRVIWIVLSALSSGSLFLDLIQHLSQFMLDWGSWNPLSLPAHELHRDNRVKRLSRDLGVCHLLAM